MEEKANVNFNRIIHSGVAAKVDKAPKDGLPEIVLAGRSNAGKSSLINSMANHRGLARVSSNPGKTQLVVYFNVDNKFYLTDLPGYGYAHTSMERKSKLADLANSYFVNNRPISLVILLLDIRHMPSVQDVQMLEFLHSQNYNYVIVLNKADKLSKSRCIQQKKLIMKFLDENEDKAYIISTTKKTGVAELVKYIAEHYNNLEI